MQIATTKTQGILKTTWHEDYNLKARVVCWVKIFLHVEKNPSWADAHYDSERKRFLLNSEKKLSLNLSVFL